MRLGAVSLICLTLAILMLAVRGAADWSTSFAVTWYGVFGAAVVLAFAAATAAVVARHDAPMRRLAILALALPALVAVPALIWVVATVAPLAD
jgi:hypothetical protein